MISNEYAATVSQLLQTIIDQDRFHLLLRPAYADSLKTAIKSINRRLDGDEFADYIDIASHTGAFQGGERPTDPALAALGAVLPRG